MTKGWLGLFTEVGEGNTQNSKQLLPTENIREYIVYYHFTCQQYLTLLLVYVIAFNLIIVYKT